MDTVKVDNRQNRLSFDAGDLEDFCTIRQFHFCMQYNAICMFCGAPTPPLLFCVCVRAPMARRLCELMALTVRSTHVTLTILCKADWLG